MRGIKKNWGRQTECNFPNYLASEVVGVPIAALADVPRLQSERGLVVGCRALLRRAQIELGLKSKEAKVSRFRPHFVPVCMITRVPSSISTPNEYAQSGGLSTSLGIRAN